MVHGIDGAKDWPHRSLVAGVASDAAPPTPTPPPSSTLSFSDLQPPTVNATVADYAATLEASGSGFNTVNQVAYTATGKNPGTWIWKKGDDNWASKVTVKSDTAMELRPHVTAAADLAGSSTWTVQLTDTTNASKSRSFTVDYTPSTPVGLTGPPKDPNGAWGPPALANTFQYPVQSGYDGTGTTVAVLIDSGFAKADLDGYTNYFKIPGTARTITTTSVNGGGAQSSGQAEATLDVETIAGLAPGAKVIVYATPDWATGLSTVDITNALNQIVSDGAANIVSMSFGNCESWFRTYMPWLGLSQIIQSGTSAGMTFVAASGDSGNQCGGELGVAYPASDPNVVAVGGTESGDSLTNPTAWNDFRFGLDGEQGSTGGGVSTLFGLPSYQSGVAGLADTQHRNVPDIALPAVNGAVYLNGSWGTGAIGTSWSAPAAAAMLAEIRQYCGRNLANANTLLYLAFAAAPADFIDVTLGNNQYADTTPPYAAKPGYDNATGLGMPLGTALTKTACPSHTPASTGRTVVTAQSGRRAAEAYTLDVRPAIRGLRDLGRHAVTATMRLQIVLRSSDTLASDEAHVIGALREAGLTIVQTFPNHLVVDADGPSGAIERLFNTTIDDVDQPQHGTRYAPARPVTIPASLAPYLSSVLLDNIVTFHHFDRR
jgi:subtilase family serine protease